MAEDKKNKEWKPTPKKETPKETPPKKEASDEFNKKRAKSRGYK
tara:strand:- start:488 stop:619 length:132 start_codon:yes stop_codon:yes gene_type:complete